MLYLRQGDEEMKKYKVILLVALFFIMPKPALASTIDHFTVNAGDDIEIKDTYNASVLGAGETVEVNGKINGAVLIAGNKVTFDGTADYSFLAGNTIILKGKVNNDAFIAGNIVTIDKDANYKRDTVIAASDIELNGNFERNITSYSSKLTLKDVTIKGDIKIYAQKITVDKTAKIEGTLYYPEDAVYKADKEAQIGKITKTKAIQNKDDENYFSTMSSKILSFMCYALAFAIISLLFPAVFNKITQKYEKTEAGEIIEVFTKGLVAIIIIPVIAVLLCCTVLGIPLAIILILLYGIAIYLTTIFTAYLLGYKIWQKVFNKDINLLSVGLIGLFILMLLNLIPGIRTLVSIITVLIGLGLIIETIRSKKQD